MNELQRHVLDAMGIQVWEQRSPTETAQGSGARVQSSKAVEEEQAPSDLDSSTLPPESDRLEQGSLVAEWEAVEQSVDLEPSTLNLAPFASFDWPQLREQVAGCTACDELVANRTQTVFGVGNQNAEWLVIGEAPGAEEDHQGEPFVGRAGQLLNAMLASIGLKREQVYIANILKCRPPNNRDPRLEEAAACAAFLQRQIELIQPKLILVVGRVAAQNLLQSDAPIGKLRGRVHQLESGVPVVATYHPAYLLRSPQEKRKAWTDLCLARSTLLAASGSEV